MLHQINLLFRRFLTDARQLFRFFVIVNLIPCILLVFTEPYSFMGKVILVTFPLGMYLFVFSWLKNIGLMQLILIPQLIFNAFQIVLFYLSLYQVVVPVLSFIIASHLIRTSQ